MNIIFAVVFNLCISLLSCRSIKYIEVDPNNDIFDKQSSSTETDNQKIVLHKMRFLKVLPLNEELKNTINEHKLEPETKNKNSVPFAVIVAAPDSNLDKFKNSKLKTTSVEGEELIIVGEEPKDISNVQVEEYKIDDENNLDNDNKELTFINIEEPIEDILINVDPESNTRQNDYLEITNEFMLTEQQIEDETNIESQLKNGIIQDNDAVTPGLITTLSKADIGSEQDIKCKNALFEINNNPKDNTVCNPELCKSRMQSRSCYEREVNLNVETCPISFMLNKYIFVK